MERSARSIAHALLHPVRAVPSEHGPRLKMSLKSDFETFCDHAAHGRLADVQQMLESGELRVDRDANANAHVALVRAAANDVDYLLH
jgi:hypothetical protein